MRKFWEIEEVPITKKLTADELKCEELFCTTTTRDETGRFCVRIPLKESADALGDSYSTARSRFMSLERKLQRSPEYKQMYCDFMNEYESSLQLIVWRDSPEDPLGVYQLNTVTYGTASAAYLSMRCLRQLASECGDDVIARVINEDFLLLLATVRECYWPLGGRNLARQVVRRCVICSRLKAHFLIGRPLTAPASADLTGAAPHRLLRYDRVEQMRQHFWRRWSKEYVSELQIRSKWKTREQDLQTDMMVLIKEDNTPPLRWRLGRIVRTYPGKDGVSRVADIRTTRGIIQRTFAKICPLPMQADEDTSGGADSTTSTCKPEIYRTHFDSIHWNLEVKTKAIYLNPNYSTRNRMAMICDPSPSPPPPDPSRGSRVDHHVLTGSCSTYNDTCSM
ncbi:unnamed protein product [Plutella xylostella]|uniref:(diamondback moth) hypothetical protein n=1 Tax=Plutella xylostella TaxID=51655 RepID=A0A8S4DGH5_PLUXY|nr:unnamed protein product [Plutella xylostella]